MLNGFLTSFGLLAAFLVGYSMYSKKTKTFEPAQLVEILLVTKSFDHTLREVNKVLALVALTCAVLALGGLPGDELKLELWYAAAAFAAAHGASSYVIYGYKHLYGEVSMQRRVAVTLGSIASTTLMLHATPLSHPMMTTVATVLGVAHFLGMEYKNGALQVRPFGYLPLLCLAGLLF